jgi:hypothetical protein
MDQKNKFNLKNNIIKFYKIRLIFSKLKKKNCQKIWIVLLFKSVWFINS